MYTKTSFFNPEEFKHAYIRHRHLGTDADGIRGIYTIKVDRHSPYHKEKLVLQPELLHLHGVSAFILLLHIWR